MDPNPDSNPVKISLLSSSCYHLLQLLSHLQRTLGILKRTSLNFTKQNIGDTSWKKQAYPPAIKVRKIWVNHRVFNLTLCSLSFFSFTCLRSLFLVCCFQFNRWFPRAGRALGGQSPPSVKLDTSHQVPSVLPFHLLTSGVFNMV